MILPPGRRGRFLPSLIPAILFFAAGAAGEAPCIACRGDPSELRSMVDPDAWARLHAGEVVAWEPQHDDPEGETTPRLAAAAGIIPRSPEQV